MIKTKKKQFGFTLIELLAVIVILAIIALIATPLVLNIIERAEKGAFKDSVYGIMEAAEFQVILDDSKYPITYVFPEDSNRVKFKGTKPTEGYIQIVSEGKIKLALGNGRWCAVKDTTDSQITVANGHCKNIDLNLPIISGYGDLNQTIHVNDSYTIPSVTATDKDGNKLNVITIIKQGDQVVDSIDTSKVGSYTITYTTEADKEGNTTSVTITLQIIKSETEADKIIEEGTKDGGLELIGDTYYYRGSNPKNYVQFNDELWRIVSIENGTIKLMRNESIGNLIWDSTNQQYWEKPAEINTYLNDTYYNSLNTTAKNQIQDGIFYIGEITWNESAPATIVKANERQKTWTGRIGLMNASDYAYASKNNDCETKALNNTNCSLDNWMYVESHYQWTLNASSLASDYHANSNYMIRLYNDGRLSCYDASYYKDLTRPVVLLKSSIKITTGDGTTESPYQLS